MDLKAGKTRFSLPTIPMNFPVRGDPEAEIPPDPLIRSEIGLRGAYVIWTAPFGIKHRDREESDREL